MFGSILISIDRLLVTWSHANEMIVKHKEFSAKLQDITDVLRVFKKPVENYICAVLIQILK